MASSKRAYKERRQSDSDTEDISDGKSVLEAVNLRKAVFHAPIALAIGDTDNGLYVIDLNWSVRKILHSGVVIVVALASYVDSVVCTKEVPAA